MTQAFNLSQLANNLNTSGQLDATDGLSGLVPLANGGTGATNTINTIVAGTGISTSVSGTQVTITSTVTGGVTSLNGQTGAIVDTNENSIGSYYVGYDVSLQAYQSGGGYIASGGTTAGSNIYYLSTGYTNQNNMSLSQSEQVTSAGKTGTWRRLTGYNRQNRTDLPNYYPSFLFVRIS